MNHEQALEAFCVESRELLEQMEVILIAGADGGLSGDDRQALFRCVHAIRGWSGMLGLDHVAQFAQLLENVLARLRRGEIGCDWHLLALLGDCREHVAALVETVAGAEPVPSGCEAALVDRLQPYLAPSPAPVAPWPDPEGGDDEPPDSPVSHSDIVEPQPEAAGQVADVRCVKVSSKRLDTLIDQVGDLVVAASATHALALRSRQPALMESANRLHRLVDDISETVLKLRLVPIGEVFSRFPRVVRDVARELGKEIRLKIVGAESRLDKSMLEKIGAPLAHLVCNAIDHGIEPEANRLLHGKPGTGTVRLIAYQEPDNFVIEVADDGGGINCDKVLKRAREQGLLSPGERPSRQDLFRLILEPGFSTAERASPFSGRGVGMDVVRRSVEALCGTLDIDSETGKGTIMRISLPMPVPEAAFSGVR